MTPPGLCQLISSLYKRVDGLRSTGPSLILKLLILCTPVSLPDRHCNLQCKNSAPPLTLLTSGFSAGWSTRTVHGSTALPGGSDGKASACNAGDPGLIPGLARSPGEVGSTHFHILTWRIPWTEQPGGLQSMGLQRVRHD